MRGMGLVPVTPHKVTSMVGHDPDSADEFIVTQLSMSRPNHIRKSPGDRDSQDRRGNLNIASGRQSVA